MLAGSVKVADSYRSKPTAVGVLPYKENEKECCDAAVEAGDLWKNTMTFANSCFLEFTNEFKILVKVSQCFV